MAGTEYRYQFLRLVPNPASDEFYNIAVVLRDREGRIIDARFTPDYKRMACHPLFDLSFVAQLRDEFEEHRLMGEDFTAYFKHIGRHLSHTLSLSDERFCLAGEPAATIDNLVRRCVATPPGLRDDSERTTNASRSRTAVRKAMQRTFEELQLFRGGQGLRSFEDVAYFDDMTFTFDYAYTSAAGADRFLHALGARNDEAEASRLCLVYDGVAAGYEDREIALTAVLAEEVSSPARKLLERRRIDTVPVGAVRELGERIRGDLGW